MIRGLTLAAVLLIGAAPMFAQTYPHGPDHVRPDSAKHHPHGPGHVRPDAAAHAAMHAALFGNWTGTLYSHDGGTWLSMTVSRDSARSVSLSMRAPEVVRLGGAANFAVNGDKLTWTQELAGASCKATAVLIPTSNASKELKGTMACERESITFALRKNAG